MTRLQTISPRDSSLVRQDVAVQVRVKDDWSGSWRTVRFLDAVSDESHAGPRIGQATFIYRYGRVMQPGAGRFTSFRPQDLEGNFVQISTVANSATRGGRLWHGVITSEQFRIDGGDVSSSGSGVQTITALELGHILNRKTLRGAYDEFPADTARLIGSMPTFNRRAQFGLGGRVLGNRSDAKIAVTPAITGGISETYVFSADGKIWTHLNILENILGRYAPDGFSFQITGQSEALASIEAVHAFDSFDLWSALNVLIDRRRGLGWALNTTGQGVLDLHVFTVVDRAVSVGDVTIPRNDSVVDNIALDTDYGVSASVQRSSEGRIDRIVVEGARIKTCFSCSIVGVDNLEPAWTSEEQVAYQTPVSADNERNDKERKTDTHRRVYQMYRLPAAWNGEGDTAVWGVGANALPSIRADGTLDVSVVAPLFQFGKSLDRSLPLLKPAAADGAEPEYQEPFAVVIDTEVTPTTAGTATAGGSLDIGLEDNASEVDDFYTGQTITLIAGAGAGQSRTITGYDGSFRLADVSPVPFSPPPDSGTEYEVTPKVYIFVGAKHAMTIRPTEGELGIVIEPAINHILAKGFFSADGDGSDVEPIYNPETLIFTLALDTEPRATVATSTNRGGPNPTTLTIRVNDAEIWYITPGTVTGISDGALIRTALGGLARDDSERLREIAALARAWYGEQRSTLDMRWRRINRPAVLGSYIRSISDSFRRRLAGTVVTTIKHVYTGGAQSTGITTSFAEMDFQSTSRAATAMQASLNSIRQRIGNLPVRFGGGDTGAVAAGARLVWNEDSKIS